VVIFYAYTEFCISGKTFSDNIWGGAIALLHWAYTVL